MVLLSLLMESRPAEQLGVNFYAYSYLSSGGTFTRSYAQEKDKPRVF